jgi:Tfp pilus assembly protein PilO
MTSRSRTWVLLTALLTLLILVAGWLLLIAPQRTQAADLRAGKAAQIDANNRLRGRITQLQQQARELPAQEARLAEIRRRVPADPGLPTLVRALGEAAGQSGAELIAVAPEQPSLLSGGAAPGVPAPSAGPSGGPPTPSTAGPTVSGTSPSGADGDRFYVIPVTLELVGSYVSLERFLDRLESLDRAFLTTGIKLSSQAAGGGGTEGGDGALTLVLNGRVFTTSPATPVVAAAATSGTARHGDSVATPAVTESPSTQPAQ